MQQTSLVAILCVLSICLNAQTRDCFDLSYEEGLTTTSPLSSLQNYTVFFLGESHFVGSNDLMDFALLTHLNRTQQLRHFIKEGAYSYIFMLAQNIETSDPYYLDLNSVREEREFIEQLAAFNKSVPKDQQIRLYGIDSEPFYHLSIMLDALVYKHGNPPKPVFEVFEILKSFQAKQWTSFISKKEKNEIKEIWERVRPIVTQNEKIFKEYLKDDWIHLMMVIDNPATTKRSENQLLDNFLKLQKLTDAKKFYFSYGSLHAQKNGGWLAALINKTDLYRGKVFSTNTIYHNSTLLWQDEYVPVNSFEKNKEEEIAKMLSTLDGCDFDFGFLSTEGLSYEGVYDLLFLTRNQKGITVEE